MNGNEYRESKMYRQIFSVTGNVFFQHTGTGTSVLFFSEIANLLAHPSLQLMTQTRLPISARTRKNGAGEQESTLGMTSSFRFPFHERTLDDVTSSEAIVWSLLYETKTHWEEISVELRRGFPDY
ncbi:hypothetical protein RRG08_046810 [Elysia crispata]|uniref:Uncharacterized protein n=1 Tax=Elysia crispata TaxID=231223 RepID=A0AAE0ZML1_9GAST|nr:hypothetical protein RRG08_046810 [Elysia crispata]